MFPLFCSRYLNSFKNVIKSFHCDSVCFNRNFSEKTMKKVLNVAEKNDAARNIANSMSKGNSQRREGFSKYNKIYEFDYDLPHEGRCKMTMTSVSGHLLDYDFDERHRKWWSCDPLALFEAPIVTKLSEDCEKIKRTLEREISGAQLLILWTDCDREGENIAFEIIQVCRKVKPNIPIKRARFSEITPSAIIRAVNNLVPPNKLASDAVQVRRELDLRIGAAFTRFQTMLIQKIGQQVKDKLISYGSCQFPTLGFVVERYKQIKEFVSNAFWYLDVKLKRDNLTVVFTWDRNRLFDCDACLALYHRILLNPRAKVTSVESRRKTHWRPVPMDTICLEKLASSKLRISAKTTMGIAEKLYVKGFISYPRTETNIFPSNLNLQPAVQAQTAHPVWGRFASQVLQEGIRPRQGKKTDNAHPPIYPIKAAENLSGDEAKIYELVVRHFLACLSSDAVGFETNIKLDINGEGFHTSGLIILEKNYLEVYPYVKWFGKEIPEIRMNEVFVPDEIFMREGKTSPPALLTESDLIALMEKHGIGTDATHAEHIETIKSRTYVSLTNDRRFLPDQLGLGLVDGYVAMGFELSRPHLRANLERDLQAVCEGRKDPKIVLREQVVLYKGIFSDAMRRANLLSSNVQRCLGEDINIRNF
ncbi:DNA topoisomerase 3-alpha-like [Panonychus citri]|uniref:DNA topoisomerase 3-alpha-like n=1 Tax=Panonychus citri TaxID=50023 RepID=UPI002307F76E|nr:DNA topoisomerase 3-alpha-like [Panonychus citri]